MKRTSDSNKPSGCIWKRNRGRSSFLSCPCCGKSVPALTLNIHLDTDCPSRLEAGLASSPAGANASTQPGTRSAHHGVMPQQPTQQHDNPHALESTHAAHAAAQAMSDPGSHAMPDMQHAPVVIQQPGRHAGSHHAGSMIHQSDQQEHDVPAHSTVPAQLPAMLHSADQDQHSIAQQMNGTQPPSHHCAPSLPLAPPPQQCQWHAATGDSTATAVPTDALQPAVSGVKLVPDPPAKLASLWSPSRQQPHVGTVYDQGSRHGRQVSML